MGFFANLFGGKKDNAADQSQALRDWFDRTLPREYVGSPLYAVDITREGKGDAAKIVLDMQADGSSYSDFAPEDFDNLAELESSCVFDQLTAPPAPVALTFDMVFDSAHRVTVKPGTAK